MKFCNICKTTKPDDQFHVWKNGAGSKPKLSAKCRDCQAAYHRTPEYRAKKSVMLKRDRALGLRKDIERRSFLKRMERHPEKIKAKQLVKNAINRGDLMRPEICEICQCAPRPMSDGRSAIQAHHDDYSQPLNVRWLCHPCHEKIHKGVAA